MAEFKNIEFVYCDRATAKRACETRHYMRTYPQGAKINIALMDDGELVGICVFGYSSQTDKKVAKIAYGVERSQYLEMQRLWISDDYGHNTESYVLSRILKKLQAEYDLQLVVTHAGGCKDDCGIVYQASGWLYFGAQPSSDFYLTEAGEYKNIIAPMRFGRVKSAGRTAQEIGEELFGPGEIVDAHRYFYAYPLNKGMRRRLSKEQLPFPKSSAMFRRDQKWVEQGASAGAAQTGSIPVGSTESGA